MDIFDLADKVTADIIPLGPYPTSPYGPLATPAFVAPNDRIVDEGTRMWFEVFPCPHCQGSVLIDRLRRSVRYDGDRTFTVLEVEALRDER